MAVFTKLDSQDIETFLKDYDLGTLERFEGILAGVENTNYHIYTSVGHYILTVHESKVHEDDLPYFLGYIQHLNNQDIPTCATVQREDGKLYGHIKGKTAAISAFLEGDGTKLNDITPEQCVQVGKILAKMHAKGAGFQIERPNKMSLDTWKQLWDQTQDKADEVVKGQADIVNAEFKLIEFLWRRIDQMDVPKGPVHCDLFADNVFFKDDTLSGIIDFYYACDEYFIYDLALTINAWCFDGDANLVKDRYKGILAGYQSQRLLTEDEASVFNIMLRASALRIQMTRLYDYLNHPGDDQVVPHDPIAFLKRIEYWKEQA